MNNKSHPIREFRAATRRFYVWLLEVEDRFCRLLSMKNHYQWPTITSECAQ